MNTYNSSLQAVSRYSMKGELLPVHKERIALWVDAIEDYSLPLASRMLKSPEGHYCLLGLACEVSQKGKWANYISIRDIPCQKYICSTEDWDYMTLPKAVFEWYGLNRIKFEPYVNTSNAEVILSSEALGKKIPNDMEGDLRTVSQLSDLLYFSKREIAAFISHTYLN